MKILMYAPIFPPIVGGPATQCFNLCRVLQRNGEIPVVVTVGEHFEHARPDGYSVYRYPWAYTHTPLDKVIRWIVLPWYFVRILKQEKPDIVHCHSVSILSFVAGWLSRKKGIPTVIKFAGDWVWETLSSYGVRTADFDELYRQSVVARFLWWVERWGLSLFDRIWAPSEFRAKNVERILGHRRTVCVIYNALDLPSGGYHEVKEGDSFVVISASRFLPHKRIPLLIKIFASLRNPSARLVLFGSDDDESVLASAKTVVAEAGIESQVSFFIRKIELEDYEYFRQASVYMSVSLEEGFPNVFVEAMHFGLPIISTDVGGCHEIVREGETGFLVASTDEEAMTERLKRLMENIDLRNRMAKSAYDHSHQYELSTVIEQFMGLYQEAMGAARR